MSNDDRGFTRGELYELVWTEPTRKVAERFGISDVGLAKACRRHKIPRPPRGYWQKVQFGKRVRRKPLPELSERELHELSTVNLRGFTASSISRGDLVRRQKEYERDPKHRIEVPEELRQPHGLLRRGKADCGTLRGFLHKNFCRKCYGRALLVLDALFKALDARDFFIDLPHHDRHDILIVAHIDDIELGIGLSEKINRVEKRRRRRRTLYFGANDFFAPAFETHYVSVCSRRLKLSIIDHDVVRVLQNWADTEKRSLESQLNSFIVGLVEASQVKKQGIAEREERESQWAEERERRAEKRRQQEDELRRVHQLEDWSEQWAKADRLRAFLSTIRQSLDASNKADMPETLGPWVWAEDYVARIDPIPTLVRQGPDALPPPPLPSVYEASSWARVNQGLPEDSRDFEGIS